MTSFISKQSGSYVLTRKTPYYLADFIVISALCFFYLEHRSSKQISVDIAYLNADVITIKSEVSAEVLFSNANIGDSTTHQKEVIRLDDTRWQQELIDIEHEIKINQFALEHATKEEQALKKRLIEIKKQIDVVRDFISVAKARHDATLLALSENAVSNDAANNSELAMAPLYDNLYDTNATKKDVEVLIEKSINQQRVASENIRHLEASLGLLSALKNKYHITVPPLSTITKVNAFKGSVLKEGDDILQFMKKDDYFITAYFSETELNRLKKEKPVHVKFDAHPNLVYTGTIKFVSPVGGAYLSPVSPNYTSGHITRITQRIPVRISINPDEHSAPLSIGMSAKVTQTL